LSLSENPTQIMAMTTTTNANQIFNQMATPHSSIAISTTGGGGAAGGGMYVLFSWFPPVFCVLVSLSLSLSLSVPSLSLYLSLSLSHTHAVSLSHTHMPSLFPFLFVLRNVICRSSRSGAIRRPAYQTGRGTATAGRTA
jgi:hypothetical protein